MTVGQNTIQSKLLRGIVEEIEKVEEQMKDLRDRKGEIMARAKAEGLTPAGIRYVVKARKMKPHDREEAETIRDTYMHAMGMAEEPPLFRAMQKMAEDELSREKLIEHFKLMCPPKGEVIVKVGGDPVRIYRDLDGRPQAEPYVDQPHASAAAPKPSTMSTGRAREVPDVDEDGAYEYGRSMYRQNKPVTENPFPYGDPRRARCDEGYRDESGDDGMGDD
ncbi:GapR family DNA-binding domain-containing protein [Nitrobacter sp.]|uniref:GapR family DNA-binding domain-containing protein n=1 Tax=Nitrobacter sp. TaxID=29420 RepID=UPI003F64928D